MPVHTGYNDLTDESKFVGELNQGGLACLLIATMDNG